MSAQKNSSWNDGKDKYIKGLTRCDGSYACSLKSMGCAEWLPEKGTMRSRSMMKVLAKCITKPPSISWCKTCWGHVLGLLSHRCGVVVRSVASTTCQVIFMSHSLLVYCCCPGTGAATEAKPVITTADIQPQAVTAQREHLHLASTIIVQAEHVAKSSIDSPLLSFGPACPAYTGKPCGKAPANLSMHSFCPDSPARASHTHNLFLRIPRHDPPENISMADAFAAPLQPQVLICESLNNFLLEITLNS